MAKRHNQKSRSKREGQYLLLPYSMLHHPAWRSLSGPAVKVWLELRGRYNGGNNGQLRLSLDEAARLLHMGKQTAIRAFAELERKGFLVKAKQGRWYGRQASEWQSTDTPCDGYPATRAWQRLEAEKPTDKNKSRYHSETYWVSDDTA